MKLKKHLIGLLSLAAIASASTAYAEDVGTVATLKGVLLVRSAEGVSKLLATDSRIQQGDTLSTDQQSSAQIRFSDGAEITIAPRTVLVVTKYSYLAEKPELDAIELGLAQGGFQSKAGLLGQRSPEATLIKTPQGNLNGAATMIVALQP
jgi:hypothetical protein